VKKLWKIEVQENFNCEKEKKKEKRLGTWATLSTTWPHAVRYTKHKQSGECLKPALDAASCVASVSFPWDRKEHLAFPVGVNPLETLRPTCYKFFARSLCVQKD
jgi:hypothetical protein